jgi:hypothetical protein
MTGQELHINGGEIVGRYFTEIFTPTPNHGK